MTQYTPGPWIADGAQVHSPRFGLIAECGLAAGKPGAFLEYEECAANARLISASLDYAAAVEMMLAYKNAPDNNGWWKGWEALKAAHIKAGLKTSERTQMTQKPDKREPRCPICGLEWDTWMRCNYGGCHDGRLPKPKPSLARSDDEETR